MEKEIDHIYRIYLILLLFLHAENQKRDSVRKTEVIKGRKTVNCKTVRPNIKKKIKVEFS